MSIVGTFRKKLPHSLRDIRVTSAGQKLKNKTSKLMTLAFRSPMGMEVVPCKIEDHY